MADSDTESLLLKLLDLSRGRGPSGRRGSETGGACGGSPTWKEGECRHSKENLDSSVTFKIFECYVIRAMQ